jgi:hypothetical protein
MRLDAEFSTAYFKEQEIDADKHQGCEQLDYEVARTNPLAAEPAFAAQQQP